MVFGLWFLVFDVSGLLISFGLTEQESLLSIILCSGKEKLKDQKPKTKDHFLFQRYSQRRRRCPGSEYQSQCQQGSQQ